MSDTYLFSATSKVIVKSDTKNILISHLPLFHKLVLCNVFVITEYLSTTPSHLEVARIKLR